MDEIEEARAAIAAGTSSDDPSEKLRQAEVALNILSRVANALTPDMSWRAKKALGYFEDLDLKPGRFVAFRYIEAKASADSVESADLEKGFDELVTKGCLQRDAKGQFALTDAGYEHIS